MLHIPIRENNNAAGFLVLRPSRVTRAVKIVPGSISVSPRHRASGKAAAAFIENAFRTAYSARIDVRYPMLMSISEPDGGFMAAIGFRYASAGPLFLEQYTHRPVEQLLECDRAQVVEIGNLASVGGGVSLYLFLALASYLHERGVVHAVATGTKNLESRLRRIGLQPRTLCPADPGSLKSVGDDWGTYYETDPMVLAGRVDLGLASLQTAFSAHITHSAVKLAAEIDHGAGFPA